MARLSLMERARVALLAADRSRRQALSKTLAAPFLRWRYGSTAPDQLLIVPPNLHVADPSFWREVESGCFGLAGSTGVLMGYSPFDIDPPTLSWARALHGFGWLRHLEAADVREARDFAREMALDWVASDHSSSVAFEPDVMSRRLISWLSHANLLLDGIEPRAYDAIMTSIGVELARLSAKWREAPRGYPRLLTLAALVLAGLCVAGNDRRLPGAERAFSAELARQILADGGHVSRNPQLIVELLLDLLPLHQCFAARGRPAPRALTASVRRMLLMLRYLRLGDGMLARFNGIGVPAPASLATVLAYDDALTPNLSTAENSGYVRLARGATVIVMDAGTPPPLEYASDAHAGCLSFEMSSGTRLLFVNGGAPGPAHGDWVAAARATASHTTLCLSERSSAELVQNASLETLVGGQPIRLPTAAGATLLDISGGARVDTYHNGYAGRFGLLHRRLMTLAADGKRLDGEDRLEPVAPSEMLRELPFAIHFHLHPDSTCWHAKPGVAAEIVLGDEKQWRFNVKGAHLSIEETLYFADSAGPRPAAQIVLRGTTLGSATVAWTVEARD